MSCHGCKHLDETRKGCGYCAMVERSKKQSEKVRRPEMEPCELYAAGDFARRWETCPK